MAHYMENDLIYFGSAASRWFGSSHQTIYADDSIDEEAVDAPDEPNPAQLELDIGATAASIN